MKKRNSKEKCKELGNLISSVKKTLCSFALIIDLIHMGKINEWRERNNLRRFATRISRVLFTVGHSNEDFENTRACPQST